MPILSDSGQSISIGKSLVPISFLNEKTDD